MFCESFGVVFLGQMRHVPDKPRHESRSSIRSNGYLSIYMRSHRYCPIWFGTYSGISYKTWNHSITIDMSLTEEVPLKWISIMAIMLRLPLFFYTSSGYGISNHIGKTTTWGCGYAAPTPCMQYTASSFADMIVDLFAGILRPDIHHLK